MPNAGSDTRERFLEAAISLFAEHGYSGTTTRKLAEAADSNIASLAYHFGGKDGLYEAALRRLHADLAEQLSQSLSDRVLPASMEQSVEVLWDFAAAHRAHIRMLLRHVLDRGRHHDAVMDKDSEPLMQGAVTLLGLWRPDLSPVRRRLIALSVMHTVARLVLEHPADRQRLVGVDGDTDPVIRAFLVDWLGQLLHVPPGDGP